MRRKSLIIVLALVALLIVTAAIAWFLIRDESFLKSQLANIALEQTGRELSVDGPLRLDLGRETTIEAHGIRFQNAAWAERPDMVTVGRLLLKIDLTSLFKETPVIPAIEIENCTIELVTNTADEANWDVFPEPEPGPEPSPARNRLPVIIESLQVQKCRFGLDEPTRDHPLTVNIDEFATEIDEEVHIRIRGAGQVNGEDFSLSGWYGPYGAFYLGGPVEHELSYSHGNIRLRSSGTLDDATTLTGANITAEFQGPDIGSVLKNLSLPPLSDGPFDFRIGLVTSDGLTRLDLDGDLGSLEIKARGELDRLLKPSAGQVNATVKGPDLEALGQAFNVQGLVPDPYDLVIDTSFEPGLVHFEDAIIQTSGERLQLLGKLGNLEGLAGTELEIQLQSDEIGRWTSLLGQPAKAIGGLTLEGHLDSDSEGLFTVRASVVHDVNTLSLDGTLGKLAGSFHPDLNFTFQSSNPQPLAAQFGQHNIPAAPVEMSGRVQLVENQVSLSAVKLDLDGHQASLDGHLNLAPERAGSKLKVEIDSSDVGNLGELFGFNELPHQALSLSGVVEPAGSGLSVRVDDAHLGELGLMLDARIEDLANPIGVDANFDLRLPSLSVLSFLLPDARLPDKPFRAKGSLRNESDKTLIDNLELTLSNVESRVSGEVFHDQRFNLSITAAGPDGSVFQEWAKKPLESEPFSLDVQVVGDSSKITLSGFKAQYGKSQAGGDLEIDFRERISISGRIESSFMDLSSILAPEGEEDEPEAIDSQSQFKFDDSPAIAIGDLGMDLRVDVTVDHLDLGNTMVRELHVGVILLEDYLELNPFSARGTKGGKTEGTVLLEGRGSIPRMDINLHGTDVRLGLAAVEGQDPSTFPSMEYELVLQGSGATKREMASSLNGRLRAYAGEGQIASAGVGLLFSDFLTELFNLLNPFAKTSEYTQVDCGVAAADIVSGQVEIFPFILQTEQMTILSEGSIDLDTETINLTFNTKPRQGLGLSAGVLINPFIKVGGNLVKPTILLDPERALVSGSVAVATVGLSLLAKSVSDRFLSSKDPCGDARKEIEKRDP